MPISGQHIQDVIKYETRVLNDLRKAHRARLFVNENYRDEVMPGKEVEILRGTNINTFGSDESWKVQKLEDNTRTFRIDQERRLDFEVEDLDELFSNAELFESHVEGARYAFSDDADEYIFSELVANAGTSLNETGLSGTADEAKDFARVFRKASAVLSNHNVPKSGRVAAVQPGDASILSEYMTEVVQSESTIREGVMGRFEGFTVVETNNLPTKDSDATTTILFTTPMAMTYADNLVNFKTYEKDQAFSVNLKGQYVYGSGVLYPTAILAVDVDNKYDINNL